MSAAPSEEAMQLASAYIQHADTCDEQYQTTLKCVCAFVREKNDLASQIDALVARRVEGERERCAELVDRAAARADGAEIDFDLLVDAIRTTPPRGEK